MGSGLTRYGRRSPSLVDKVPLTPEKQRYNGDYGRKYAAVIAASVSGSVDAADT